MVGYMGENQKTVPRWAVNDDSLLKVLNYQSKQPNKAQLVFGRIKPKTIQKQFLMDKVFQRGDDARSYLDARGSSVDWND